MQWSVPTKLEHELLQNVIIDQISVGSSHVLFLVRDSKNKKRVICWGELIGLRNNTLTISEWKPQIPTANIEAVLATVFNSYILYSIDPRELLWIIIGAASGALLIILVLVSCFTTILCMYFGQVAKNKKYRDAENTQGLLNAAATESTAAFDIDKSCFEIAYESLKDVHVIGTGSSGAIVLRAKWNGDFVAVKLYQPSLVSSQTDLQSFKNECTILASARHYNIVSFFGAWYNHIVILTMY